MSDPTSIAGQASSARALPFTFSSTRQGISIFRFPGTRYFLMGAVSQERPFPGFDGPLDDLRHDLIEGGLDLEYGESRFFAPRHALFFNGSRFLQERPFRAHGPLDDLRHDIIEGGLDLEYFHAAEDRQAVRDRAFAAMHPHMDAIKFDCVVVEKCKTGPALQVPQASLSAYGGLSAAAPYFGPISSGGLCRGRGHHRSASGAEKAQRIRKEHKSRPGRDASGGRTLPADAPSIPKSHYGLRHRLHHLGDLHHLGRLPQMDAPRHAQLMLWSDPACDLQ